MVLHTQRPVGIMKRTVAKENSTKGELKMIKQFLETFWAHHSERKRKRFIKQATPIILAILDEAEKNPTRPENEGYQTISHWGMHK